MQLLTIQLILFFIDNSKNRQLHNPHRLSGHSSALERGQHQTCCSNTKTGLPSAAPDLIPATSATSPLAWDQPWSRKFHCTPFRAKRPVFWYCSQLREALTHIQGTHLPSTSTQATQKHSMDVLLLRVQLCSSLEVKCFKIEASSLFLYIIYILLLTSRMVTILVLL